MVHFSPVTAPESVPYSGKLHLGIKNKEEWEFSLRDLRDILKDKPSS